MANFIRGANPIWSFVDPQTGLPLNDEYYAFFLTNTLPYLPQPIYRDNQGVTVWPGYVVELTAGGTLPQNLFFDDSLVYRIQIRHGNSSSDLLIYDIPDFIPGEEPVNPDSGGVTNSDNQITNPQFTYVNFADPASTPYTIIVAGTYQIAPGWQLILTGTGSTILSQVALQGSDNIDNNPAFALSITNTGWSSAILQQTFNHNGALWANEAVVAQVTGEALIVNQNISINYLDSNGLNIEVAQGVLTPGGFTTVSGAVELPASSNTDLSTNAYILIDVVLPNNGGLIITNVFVYGSNVAQVSPVIETTQESQLNDLFHYYYNSLLIQPKNTLVVGWNFRQNPYQFVNVLNSITVGTTPVYVADQTIMAASTAASISVSVTQPSTTVPFGLLAANAITGTTQGQIFWLQYIDPKTIQGWWGANISVLVRGRLFSSGATNVRLKCRLFTGNGLPNTLSATDPISGFDAQGNPIFQGSYTPIAPPNDPSYPLQNNWETTFQSPPQCPFIAFNKIPTGIQLNSQVNATIGIMIYTVGTLNATLNDAIVMQDISVTPNDFAIDTTPKTYDQVLRECEFYYENSYDYLVPVGTVTSNGAKFNEMLVGTANTLTTIELFSRSFGLTYRTVKRGIASNVGFRSIIAGTNSTVSSFLRNGGVGVNQTDLNISNWTPVGSGTKGITFLANNATVLSSQNVVPNAPEAYISYHYTVDSRLGV